MSIIDEYQQQRAWRSWPLLFDRLPNLKNALVLDLGSGVGDNAADLSARGAQVIGLDLSPELTAAAQARQIPNAHFRIADLRLPLELDRNADGIWGGFVAAYFPSLVDALRDWTRWLKPGGWVALVEIDDLFGHEPIPTRARELLSGYVSESLAARRYDFCMGRKLAAHLREAGLTPLDEFVVPDAEFAASGPLHADIIAGWRRRFDRMLLLQQYCGDDFPAVRDAFLACLAREDHRSHATVRCCIATR
ncbi:MAG: class I SAM-dependent methyltransferase [Phycisphaerae bacterium]|nr:class I SAM-dependent methyltransferase [Phycisphaerae bacterium]